MRRGQLLIGFGTSKQQIQQIVVGKIQQLGECVNFGIAQFKFVRIEEAGQDQIIFQ